MNWLVLRYLLAVLAAADDQQRNEIEAAPLEFYLESQAKKAAASKVSDFSQSV